MFYVRHPKEKGQELIGQALATLWMVVHSVQGIMFKDLKQILRKEQVRSFNICPTTWLSYRVSKLKQANNNVFMSILSKKNASISKNPRFIKLRSDQCFVPSKWC